MKTIMTIAFILTSTLAFAGAKRLKCASTDKKLVNTNTYFDQGGMLIICQAPKDVEITDANKVNFCAAVMTFIQSFGSSTTNGVISYSTSVVDISTNNVISVNNNELTVQKNLTATTASKTGTVNIAAGKYSVKCEQK